MTTGDNKARAPLHASSIGLNQKTLLLKFLHPQSYMGGCQNYGPFLGTLNTRCRIKKNPKRNHNFFDNHPYALKPLQP